MNNLTFAEYIEEEFGTEEPLTPKRKLTQEEFFALQNARQEKRNKIIETAEEFRRNLSKNPIAHTLRKYQIEALKQISVAHKNGFKRIMVKLPTGAGKTSLASHIINNMNKAGKRVLFVCDRIELINQTSARLFADGIDHGVIQADHPLEDSSKLIQVCSIQTLDRREILNADMIIIDEAHTLYSAHIRLIKANPNIPILGLSATPFTRGLGKYFETMVVGATTQQLIDLGFLCKPTVFAPTEPDLENVKVVAGEYKNDDLSKAVNIPRYVGDIVSHWLKLADNKSTICFAVDIAHSKNIVDEFQKYGVNAAHIDAYTPKEQRRVLIANFKAGIIKVLSSVDVLSKGFDYPGAEVAILARPTKSLSTYIQQGGRVLRISPETGKKGCLILDHAGNTAFHGYVQDETTNILDSGDKKSSKSSVSKLKEVKKSVKACPSCFFMKSTAKCPNCGHESIPKNTSIGTDGYLVEMTEEIVIKPKTGKDFLVSDKFRLYGELKQYCIDKNYKIGSAYYMFNDLVGEFPDCFVSDAPLLTPSQQLIGYFKYLAIRKAKSKYFRK